MEQSVEWLLCGTCEGRLMAERRPARIRGEEELQALAAGKVSIGLRTPTPDFQRVGINHRRGQAVAAPHECHIRLTEQPTQMDSEGRAGLLKAL